jgi:hypothetical protein
MKQILMNIVMSDVYSENEKSKVNELNIIASESAKNIVFPLLIILLILI